MARAAAWICPRCDRPFGRANRPHTCEPGMPVEVWLDGLPDAQRDAALAVLAIVRRYRGLLVEAVGVGVLVKRGRTVLELRSKTRWLDLCLVTNDALAGPRIAREIAYAGGHVYYVHLHDKRDVDREVRAMIAAALRAPR